MKTIDCKNCKKKIKPKHFNQKYCKPCIKELRIKPKHALTKEQIKQLKQLVGKIKRSEIAEKIKCSRSSLQRYARDNNIKFRISRYSEALKNEVVKYYIKHGKPKTIKRFPGVKVRSIIERNPLILGKNLRQKRWTEKQLIDLTKMAGIITIKKQYKYFNRPRAFVGSIKSAWTKKFNCPAKSINGLFRNKAKYIVKNSCPYIKVDFYKNSKLYLWVDIEKHLKDGLTKDIHLLASAGATFQRWLWGKNTKANIMRFIKNIDTKTNL